MIGAEYSPRVLCWVMTAREFNALLHKAHTDGAALSALYRFLMPKLVWYIGYRFGNSVPAYDLAHDFFLSVQEGKFSQTKVEKPLAWAYRVVFNLASHYIRKEERVAPLTEGECPVAESDNATVLAVREALANLEEPQKTIVRLKGMYGVHFQEIAEILDMNLSTVKTLYYRGLKDLKNKLS